MNINWKKLKQNIPHKFKVKKSEYETVYITELDNGATVGEVRFSTQQIVLVNKQSAKQTVSTFFHEYLHVLSEEYNAKLTEKQVLALEKSLPDLLKLIGELNK